MYTLLYIYIYYFIYTFMYAYIYIYIYINIYFNIYIYIERERDNSRADVVCLLAEPYETKSNIKFGGFQSQLQASYLSS